MSPPARVDGARCWGPDAKVASSKFENAEIAQAGARLAELRETSKTDKDAKEIRKIFSRLRKTEVTVEALRQTGVGTEVNQTFFRQHSEVDIRALSEELVQRWKDMVSLANSADLPRRDERALDSSHEHDASEGPAALEESPRPAITASEFLARARQGVQGVQAKKAEERRAALKKARETEKRRSEKRLRVEAELHKTREAEKKRRRSSAASSAKSEQERMEIQSCSTSATTENLSEATTAIELNVTGVERLGIGFFTRPGEWTVANIVSGEFVDSWNKEHASTKICLGDKIIDVNGDPLLEEKPPLSLAVDGLLRLRLRKAGAPTQHAAPSVADPVAHGQDSGDRGGKHQDKELVCLQGHTLMFCKVTPELQGSCDLCGQRVCLGDAVLDCRACNWYMCRNCEVQAKHASQK